MQVRNLDGKAVPENLRVQVLKQGLIGVLFRKGLHGLFLADELGGGHVGHRLQFGLQGFCLLLRIAVVHIGQNLILLLQVLEQGVGIHGHQGEGAHNQQARHCNADGREGHKAVAEHVAKALMEKITKIVLTHGYDLPHSRRHCR